MPLVTRALPRAKARGWIRVVAAAVAIAELAAPRLAAQGLPAFAPINPMATSRSGVYFEPYQDVRPRAWMLGLDVDYASAIEYNERAGAEYVLDAELLRLDLAARHDLGPRSFVQLDLNARGA